jgi:ribosomal protein L29
MKYATMKFSKGKILRQSGSEEFESQLVELKKGSISR